MNRFNKHIFYFIEPFQWRIFLRFHKESIKVLRLRKVSFVGSDAFISKSRESIDWLNQRDSDLTESLLESSLTFIEETEVPYATHNHRPRFMVKKWMTDFQPEGLATQLVAFKFLWDSTTQLKIPFPSLQGEIAAQVSAMEKTQKWFSDHHVDQRAIDEIQEHLEQVAAGNVR